MGHGSWEDTLDILKGKAPVGELPKQIAPWIPNKPSVNAFADQVDPAYTPRSPIAESAEQGANKFLEVLEDPRNAWIGMGGTAKISKEATKVLKMKKSAEQLYRKVNPVPGSTGLDDPKINAVRSSLYEHKYR